MYNFLPLAAAASLIVIFSSSFLASNPEEKTEKIWPEENYTNDYQVENFQVEQVDIFKSDGKPQIKSDFILFRYPGSTILSYNEKQMELESLDEPDQITDWYENKIAELKFNIKNIIRTNTNEKINNSLTGVSEKKEWTIDVTKEQVSPIVKIKINETK